MRKLLPWFGAAIILVLIFGTMYCVVQQAQRNDADYPQIQIAEDAAASLNQNVSPAALTTGRVPMDMSLGTFTIIYDKSGGVVGGSGYVNDVIPTIPYGVLAAANHHEYHRVTWQPQGNVRIAAVVVSANKYYVLSGRSLRVVESNIERTFQIAFAGGVVSLAVLVATYIAWRCSGQK